MVKFIQSHLAKAFIVLCMVIALNGLSVFAQDEQNLLINPGFENPYITVPGNPDRLVANGWTPWHNPRTNDMESFRNAQPEYRGTAPDVSRIRTGENAQLFFSTWLTHDGGIYQVVTTGIAPNVEYLFSVYAYVWSNDFDDDESRELSSNPGGITLQVGIDPLGGSNPNSANIVWSVPVEQYDAYRQYSIIARSAGSSITVWVRSRVSFPQANNFIYLDDASLTRSTEDIGIIDNATNTPFPTNTVPPTNTPNVVVIPTNTPQIVVVPTNTPEGFDPTPTREGIVPTNTDIPTNTTVPTNTDIPTSTPLPTNTPIPEQPSTVIVPTNTQEIVVVPNTDVPTSVPQPTNTPQQVVDLVTNTPRPPVDRPAIGGPFNAEYPNTLLHIVRRGDTVGRLAVLYGSSIDAIAAANGLDDRYLIFVAQELAIPVRIPPPATTTPTPTLVPTETPIPTATSEIISAPNIVAQTVTYRVRPGDTLNRIASEYNTTVPVIAQANGITNPNRIFVGQILIIPSVTPPNIIVVVVTATPQPPQSASQPITTRTHTVQYGDTLYRIAIRYGVTVADLLRANPSITNRSLIFTGQVINLP